MKDKHFVLIGSKESCELLNERLRKLGVEHVALVNPNIPMRNHYFAELGASELIIGIERGFDGGQAAASAYKKARENENLFICPFDSIRRWIKEEEEKQEAEAEAETERRGEISVKVVSDGTPEGTHVIDMRTGAVLNFVQKVSWGIGVNGLAKATIELTNVPVKLVGGAELIEKS